MTDAFSHRKMSANRPGIEEAIGARLHDGAAAPEPWRGLGQDAVTDLRAGTLLFTEKARVLMMCSNGKSGSLCCFLFLVLVVVAVLVFCLLH